QVAVDVPAPDARRLRRVPARLRRRHPEHAREGPQLHLAAVLVAADAGVCVELPDENPALSLGEAQALVHRGHASAADGEAVRPDADVLDPYRERLLRARAA